ncbi:MAG: galactokinase family protein [Thermomicrobiales bacterium]
MTTEPVRLALAEAGRRTFGDSWTPTTFAAAPGRLELLGNHIDYSGGLVLAGAIDRTVQIGTASDGRPGEIEVALAHGDLDGFSLWPEGIGDWQTTGGEATPADYLRGVIASLKSRSIPVNTGIRMSIAGDVPIGFGMSSSAALCVASVLALAQNRPNDRDIVLIAQEAEHRAGSPVGAMDQSASVAGEIILFNGGDVSWQHLRPELGPYVFAVASSGVSHALSASSYPVRVQEAGEALRLIQEQLDAEVMSLADVTSHHLARIEQADWINQTLTNRVRHVVSESERVAQGVLAVAQGDWQQFGNLMSESGRSSATDYEISHLVVEELVTLLKRTPGVLGARMMGGGEGGPALALIEREAVPSVRQALDNGFYARHPLPDAFQICAFGPGAFLN